MTTKRSTSLTPPFPQPIHWQILLICVLLSGCMSSIAPWERGALARPQMALEPDALDSALRLHTFSSKEAAAGGYGVGGGGCGCN